MKEALFFDQGLLTTEQRFTPFALTDLLTALAGERQQPIVHFWQLPHTLILGMKDSRVPFLKDALQTVSARKYAFLLRNAGGLGVIGDSGVLNVSLILPDSSHLSIDEGYQQMVDWFRRSALAAVEVTDGEVPDSYCPGRFDLSIAGKKIAGIAQRRTKGGIAIMMYLSVNGDQPKRGEIIRDFYQAGLKEDFGKNGYPPVDPTSMINLADALQTSLSIEEVKHALLAVFPHQNRTDQLAEFMRSTEFQKRLASMEHRNLSLQEASHDLL